MSPIFSQWFLTPCSLSLRFRLFLLNFISKLKTLKDPETFTTVTPSNSAQNLPSCFPLNPQICLTFVISQPPCPQSLSSSIHSVLCSQIHLPKDECSDWVISLISKLLVLLNKSLYFSA